MPSESRPGYSVAPDGSVTFVYRDAAADSVWLAGDFTGWSARPLALARVAGSDLWTVRTPPLGRGIHAYKFMTGGGRWLTDPANPLLRQDGYGGRNSAVVIGARPLGDERAVRVASLNLHTYQETDPIAKLAQVAFGAAAMGVDVLVLQEVGEHMHDPARPNAGRVLQEHLEIATGRPWYHEWREAHVGFDVYREGLSLLSSAPLRDVAEHELNDGRSGGWRRIALVGTTTLKGVALRLASVHLSYEPNAARERETATLLGVLARDVDPALAATLVAGDFNAGEREPTIQRMHGAGYSDMAAVAGRAEPTWGEPQPTTRIDYHFLRPAPGRAAPQVAAWTRIFDGSSPEDGAYRRVSDHVGVLGAYLWPESAAH